MSTPDISFDVGACNGEVQRDVFARWSGGDHRAHFNTTSAVSRERFFRQLAEKTGAESADLLKRYDSELTAAADEADALVEEALADAPEGDDGPKQSQATMLVELAADAELWRDPDGTGYATIQVDKHKEHWRLRSKQFKTWLSYRAYQKTQKAPNSQALADALTTLEGKALHAAAEHETYVRLAEHDGRIYLDLCDREWRAIEIDSKGWRVVENPPIRFRRAKGMLPLPVPVAGGSVDELRDIVNVSDDGFVLLVGWQLGALRPKGPYPALALFAEQGSGKSMTGRLLRLCVDPNSSLLRSEPREPRDLAIAANNSWVIALDNLSYIPSWLSNCLCRLATGGGFSTRTLYENDEETIFESQRPVLLTAIDDVATRSDFLDRCIVVPLPTIPEDRRRTEAELFAAFDQAHPRILGALLDAVSAGLRNLPTTNLERLPRMADFAQWVSAAEPGLGWKRGTFLDIYTGNRREANELALEASPVAKIIMDLADEHGAWEGTTTELLAELDTLAAHDPKRVPKGWPANAKSLSSALKLLAPNLRAAGVLVATRREPDKKRRRMVSVECTADRARILASDASEPSEGPQNTGDRRTHAGSNGRTADARGVGNEPTPDAPDASDALLPPCSGWSDGELSPADQAALDDFNSR